MRNYWSVAFIVSIAAHVAAITGLPSINSKTTLLKKTTLKEVKITPKEIKKIKSKAFERLIEGEPPPYEENIMDKLITNNQFSALQKPKIFEKNSKEIVFTEIPQENKELSKNPAYSNYYRLIREKIRKNAYQNYRSKEKGEILLNFTILNNGSLTDLDLASQSAISKYLRSIAIKSVKESAPFPEFPDGLNKYSRLEFNISIYFKNN